MIYIAERTVASAQAEDKDAQRDTETTKAELEAMREADSSKTKRCDYLDLYAINLTTIIKSSNQGK